MSLLKCRFFSGGLLWRARADSAEIFSGSLVLSSFMPVIGALRLLCTESGEQSLGWARILSLPVAHRNR